MSFLFSLSFNQLLLLGGLAALILIALNIVLCGLILVSGLVKTQRGRRWLEAKIKDATLDEVYFEREYADPRNKRLEGLELDKPRDNG